MLQAQVWRCTVPPPRLLAVSWCKPAARGRHARRRSLNNGSVDDISDETSLDVVPPATLQRQVRPAWRCRGIKARSLEACFLGWHCRCRRGCRPGLARFSLYIVLLPGTMSSHRWSGDGRVFGDGVSDDCPVHQRPRCLPHRRGLRHRPHQRVVHPLPHHTSVSRGCENGGAGVLHDSYLWHTPTPVSTLHAPHIDPACTITEGAFPVGMGKGQPSAASL